MIIDRQLTDNEVAMLDNVPFRLGVGLQFPVETVEIPLGQWLKNLYERAQVGSFFSLAVGGGPTGAVSSTSVSEPLTLSSGLAPDPTPTSSSTVSTTITSSIPAGSPQPILTVSTATTDAFTLDAAGLLAISDLVLKQKPDGSRFIYIKDVVTVNVNSSPLVVRSGKGGPGDATLAGGLGGNIVISAGAGGDGSAAQLAANGGSVYVNGGSSGFNLGGGAAAGGSVHLDAGTGGTNNGDVVIGVTLARSVLLGGATTKLSFFGAVAANQPNAGGSITNSITAGGTADTFVDYTDLTVYATDAAAIRNNMYQLAAKVKKIDDALRLLGIVV